MPKITVSDPKTGKSHPMELDKGKLGEIAGRRIGEEVDGGFVGLPGYKLRLTGGTDKQGFAMRRGVHKMGRSSLLLEVGRGFARGKDGLRRRKTVQGEIYSDDIEQVNMLVIEQGKTPLEEILQKKGA